MIMMMMKTMTTMTMIKKRPAQNARFLVSSLSFSALFTMVTGLEISNQVSQLAEQNNQTLLTTASSQLPASTPEPAVSSSQVANTIVEAPAPSSAAKIDSVTTTKKKKKQKTTADQPAVVVVEPAPVSEPVVTVVEVAPAPAPAADATSSAS